MNHTARLPKTSEDFPEVCERRKPKTSPGPYFPIGPGGEVFRPAGGHGVREKPTRQPTAGMESEKKTHHEYHSTADLDWRLPAGVTRGRIMSKDKYTRRRQRQQARQAKSFDWTRGTSRRIKQHNAQKDPK